jgi:uncharacterized protein
MAIRLTLIGLVLAMAANAASAGNRIALVIGIADYSGGLRLENSVNDATAVSTALRDLGFNVAVEFNIERGRFIEALSDFYARADDAEAALFYFSGHALQLRGINYLLPKDAKFRDVDQIKAELIALQDILDAIKDRTTGVKLTILDACRNNPINDQLQRSIRGHERSSEVPRGLAPVLIGRNVNTLLVFAASAGHTALDGTPGGNSPFTHALLTHIGTRGLSVADMMAEVTADVDDFTGGQQIPEIVLRIRKPFYFNPSNLNELATSTPVGDRLVFPETTRQCNSPNPPLSCYLGSR